MEKKLSISVNINSQFNIEVSPNLDHWNDADDNSKIYYVTKQVKEFFLENIDDIIDDLLNGSKIEFN